MAEIKPGDFIKVSYTAKLENGEVIDTTDEKIAKEYGIYNEDARYGDIIIVVGENNVVKGLDEELAGKDVGFKGTIKVPPEKAFGERDENKVEVISIKKFKEKPKVGQRVRINNKVGTVKRIIGRRVFVDFNHPLAGETLIFDVEVKEKVEDLKEKIKALFVIYTGLDVDVEVDGDGKKVRVIAPKGASLNHIFAIGKYDSIAKIFKLLDIDEIEIVERFIKEEEMKMLKAVDESEIEDKGELEEVKTETSEKEAEVEEERKEIKEDELKKEEKEVVE